MNRKQIVERIQAEKTKLKELRVKSIGLFGSYRREEQTDRSDLDILIDFAPEQENFDNFMATYDLLESAFSTVKVELVTKNGLSEFIGPYILKEVEYVEICN